MKISVIIVYTNVEQKDEALFWIKKQTIYSDTEVILLNNSNNSKFSSAAKALNYGASISKGEVLIFMHQDVYLWEEDVLSRYYDMLAKNEKTIAGVAGIRDGSPTISDIYETKDKLHRASWANGEIIEVDSVDECMFGMNKKLWEKLRFDETCCDSWHCYALEICLNNTLNDGKTFILPAKICHESFGNSLQKSFAQTIKKIIKKYKKTSIKRIHSCCVNVKCTWKSYYLYVLKCCIKKIINKLKIKSLTYYSF